MGKSNTQQLAIAKKYLGEGGARFRKFCGMKGGAYCNAYVDYVFNEADNASLFCGGKKITYCPTSIKWCYDNLAMIPIYLAMPSDVIYFDWEPNGTPNHIGFVDHRISATMIATIEGNTSKVVIKDGKEVVVASGVVAERNRALYNKKGTVKYIQAVFRPHFPATYKLGTIEVDGLCGYHTIANLQRALGVTVDGILGQGTVKALQKKAGVTADGLWGDATSKAVQKMAGATVDGLFGPESVKALQRWINKMNASPRVLKKAIELSWPKGTKSSTYAFSGGKPTSAFKKVFDKVFPTHNKWGRGPKTGASCDVASATVVRASGVEPNMPRGYTEQIAYAPKNMQKLTYANVAPYSVAKAGDMICYTKNKSGSERHVVIMGEGCIYEAQYQKTYLHYNSSLSKVKTVRPKVWIFREK